MFNCVSPTKFEFFIVRYRVMSDENCLKIRPGLDCRLFSLQISSASELRETMKTMKILNSCKVTISALLKFTIAAYAFTTLFYRLRTYAVQFVVVQFIARRLVVHLLVDRLT